MIKAVDSLMDDEPAKESSEEEESLLINDKATVIFFHGNSGNIGNRIDFVKNYIDLADVNVLIGNQ